MFIAFKLEFAYILSLTVHIFIYTYELYLCSYCLWNVKSKYCSDIDLVRAIIICKKKQFDPFSGNLSIAHKKCKEVLNWFLLKCAVLFWSKRCCSWSKTCNDVVFSEDFIASEHYFNVLVSYSNVQFFLMAIDTDYRCDTYFLVIKNIYIKSLTYLTLILLQKY